MWYFSYILKEKKARKKKLCDSASNRIKSRGPDQFFENYFLNNKLYISNSVLSITGELDRKKNLFESHNKNFSIAFNGEIYNWQELKNLKKNFFYYKNDTELLVNMHEDYEPIEIPKKIDGMFAYCTYNKKRNEIYFASDTQGEKKLFYFNNDDYLIISSTISSILVVLGEKKLNLESINNYFNTRHYLFFGETCYKNIKVLAPGSILNFNLNKNILSGKKFDDPFSWISERKTNDFIRMKENEIIEYFNILISDQLKAMVPNRKFGSIFSGGIDSSLQTALLTKIHKPNKIITLNHVGKDKITENINLFQKFIQNKINVIHINKKKYLNDLKKSYEITKFPFLVHDFVGKYQLSKFLRIMDVKSFLLVMVQMNYLEATKHTQRLIGEVKR